MSGHDQRPGQQQRPELAGPQTGLLSSAGVAEELRNADLRVVAVDDGAFTHLNKTRTDVLGRAELLKRPVPADALEQLGRLVELYELRRDLDFFWFGLTMLVRADDDVKRQRLESLSRGSAALAELAAVAQKAVAEKLVEDVMDCRASKPK